MAIQMRRGLKANFDPTKLLPGEWAVAIDTATSNQIVWMCFAPGVVKRMGTYEDFKNMIGEISADIRADIIDATNKANASASKANEATVKANNAAANANEAAKAVLDEKYILTTRGTFTNSTSESPTAKGNVIVEKMGGATYQKSVPGNQLFDASKVASKTSVGITLTNMGDGSFNINGTATGYFQSNMVVLDLPAGEYSKPVYNDRNLMFVVVLTKPDGSSVSRGSYTTFTVEDGDVVEAYFYVTSGATVSNVSCKPMINAGSTLLPWEPFVGGTPSPNPSYPQRIEAVGDKGWFDGELYLGNYRNDTGELASTNAYVCSKNMIPCKEGDVVKVAYPSIAQYIFLFLYDKDRNYITSTRADNVSSREYTMPSGVGYFHFSICKASGAVMSVEIAEHICVTINGKYAAIVDDVGKNLINLIVPTSALSSYIVPLKITEGDYIFSFYNEDGSTTGISDGGTYIARFEDEKGNVIVNYVNEGRTVTPEQAKQIKRIYCVFSNSNYSGSFANAHGQLERGKVRTGYKPYTHKRTYIPLSAPLYERDYIRMNDGKYECVRGSKEIVYDGTENDWAYDTTGSNYCFRKGSSLNPVAKQGSELLSTHFKYKSHPYVSPSGTKNVFGTESSWKVIYFASELTTVAEWKSFLAERYASGNPVKVVYKLATPIIEELDQAPFYEIMAHDGATNISIPMADNLLPENVFRFPRSEDGALVTTDFANGKKNEIKMSELETKLATVMLNLV